MSIPRPDRHGMLGQARRDRQQLAGLCSCWAVNDIQFDESECRDGNWQRRSKTRPRTVQPQSYGRARETGLDLTTISAPESN